MKYTPREAIQISSTTLNQLTGTENGKSVLVAMVGANNFTYSNEGETTFSFKLCRKANIVKITLTDSDLYDIKFFKNNRKTYTFETVYEVTDLYADQLKEVFTSFTGLDTSL